MYLRRGHTASALEKKIQSSGRDGRLGAGVHGGDTVHPSLPGPLVPGPRQEPLHRVRQLPDQRHLHTRPLHHLLRPPRHLPPRRPRPYVHRLLASLIPLDRIADASSCPLPLCLMTAVCEILASDVSFLRMSENSWPCLFKCMQFLTVNACRKYPNEKRCASIARWWSISFSV